MPNLSEILNNPFLYSIAIVLGFVLFGIWAKKYALPRFQKALARRRRRYFRLIIRIVEGFSTFWTLLISIYFIYFVYPKNLPYSTEIKLGLEVLFIASFFYFFYEVLLEFNLYYTRKGKLPSTTIFINIAKLVVILLAITTILNALGYSIYPLIATLGVGALAIALALQDSLANLFSGISIVAAKQINLGDYIQLDTNQEGYVVDINWRSTTIRTLQNNLIILPNTTISSSKITNYSLPKKEMNIKIPIGVSYDSNLEEVERITLEVAKDMQINEEGGIRDFEPRIRYTDFADFSINFNVVLRINEFEVQYKFRHIFIKKLFKAYKENNIEIPFPIRTVYLKANEEKK